MIELTCGRFAANSFRVIFMKMQLRGKIKFEEDRGWFESTFIITGKPSYLKAISAELANLL